MLSCFSFLPRSCCSLGSAALPGMLQGPGQRGGEGASSQLPPPGLDAALCPPRPPRGWWPCPAVAVPPSPLPRSMEPGINIKSMPPQAAPFNPFAPTSRHPGGGFGRTDGHNRAPPRPRAPLPVPYSQPWGRAGGTRSHPATGATGDGGRWAGDTGVTSQPGGVRIRPMQQPGCPCPPPGHPATGSAHGAGGQHRAPPALGGTKVTSVGAAIGPH